jgi:hypothetical protein
VGFGGQRHCGRADIQFDDGDIELVVLEKIANRLKAHDEIQIKRQNQA